MPAFAWQGCDLARCVCVGLADSMRFAILWYIANIAAGARYEWWHMAVGRQQLMAGRRRFCVSSMRRNDLAALTEEAAKISGLPYVMDAYRKEAMDVMNGKAMGMT